VTTEDRGETLRVSFPEEMATDTYTYARDPPTVARVERRGRDLLVKSPVEFAEWLGEPPAGVELQGYESQTSDIDSQSENKNQQNTETGLLGRVRTLFD